MRWLGAFSAGVSELTGGISERGMQLGIGVPHPDGWRLGFGVAGLESAARSMATVLQVRPY